MPVLKRYSIFSRSDSSMDDCNSSKDQIFLARHICSDSSMDDCNDDKECDE